MDSSPIPKEASNASSLLVPASNDSLGTPTSTPHKEKRSSLFGKKRPSISNGTPEKDKSPNVEERKDSSDIKRKDSEDKERKEREKQEKKEKEKREKQEKQERKDREKKEREQRKEKERERERDKEVNGGGKFTLKKDAGPVSLQQKLSMAQKLTELQLSEEARRIFEPLTVPTAMLKLPRSGKWPVRRKFFLDLDKLQISWISERKTSDKSCVFVRDVVELRHGQKTERFLKRREYFDDNLAFSIIYGSNFESLDLICNTEAERDAWVYGIRLLIEKTGGDNLYSFLKQTWARVDANGDGKLDFGEVLELLKILNVNCDRKRAKADFDAVDHDKNGTLDFNEFTEFYQSLRFRKELFNLYRSLVDSEWSSLSLEEMKTFLVGTQEEQIASDEEFAEIIKSYVNDKGMISLEGFARYMESPRNSILKYPTYTVYQDMTRPLAHYYILSSHNTYLLGDQLKGKSSVEAYIRALQQGCRCVELDCWDGSNGEPVIFHGHTLTTKILFRDVIEAIKEYAFVASDYPLILSLENHCSLAQQEVMANIMIETFGDLLCKEPLPDNDGFAELPSPQQLRRKILLKGKSISNSNSQAVASPSRPLVPDEDEESEESDLELIELADAEAETPKDHKDISKKLSDITVYCKTTSFKSFAQSQERNGANEMSSFSEKRAEKLSKTPEEFIRHNRRQLSRIYPAGSRVDSSNYSPLSHWATGCQIVALNFQTSDLGMDLNYGKFQENGRCGYVLKPRHLLEDGVPPAKPQTLKFRFISAQQLPKPDQSLKGEIIDPYVELEVFGPDGSYKKVKTKTVQDNGFNPTWNEEFEFVVTDPELTMLRVVVMDEDMNSSDFIASSAFPLSCLGLGFRHVPLYDSKHTLIPFSSLYVKAKLFDIVS